MLGGTGQPVARGAHLAGVFSWECEDDYLCGRSPSLRRWRLWSGLIVTAIFVGFVLSMITLVVPPDHPELLWLGGLIGAVTVVPLFGKALVDHGRRRRLEREGLYIGHIRACAGRKEYVSGHSDNWRRVFRVRVAWSLRLPDGRVLEQESTFDRDDLGRGERPMPPPGAPVAVLVRSPTEFMVL